MAGFSLHAGVAVKPNQREKLERLCRYICRPPVSEKRLFITPRGDIGYSLKTPYRDGTTHVRYEVGVRTLLLSGLCCATRWVSVRYEVGVRTLLIESIACSRAIVSYVLSDPPRARSFELMPLENRISSILEGCT